jgi:hypothetical protein
MLSTMTRARKLRKISDPRSADLVDEVFDAAWRHLEPALEAQPPEIVDGARNLLVTTIIDRVRRGQVHPAVLHDEVIGVVKGSYPQLPISGTYLF